MDVSSKIIDGITAAMVATAASAGLIDGLVGATTTAAKLIATETPCSEVAVQADPSNTSNVLVGGASPRMVLIPGQTISIAIDDVSKVWVRAVTGTQSVAWLARS